MARTPRSERVMLKVNVQFEPNRLSEQCLMTAYELALPVCSEMIAGSKAKPRLQKSEGLQTRLAVNNG